MICVMFWKMIFCSDLILMEFYQPASTSQYAVLDLRIPFC